MENSNEEGSYLINKRIHFTLLPKKKENSLKSPVIVPIEKLKEEPYASVLCFPKPREAELQSRLEELKSHDVTALEFSGKASAYGIPAPLLGKGYVGIVVIAYLKGQRVALKILRVDADRPDLLHEAQMLAKANTVNVGPKLFRASKSFLLTQFIDGDLLPVWLENHEEKTLVQEVLCEVLENCYRLDQIGLDHGELSKAPKHVIINQQHKPFFVDFETASDARKPANVSAICHFLFTSVGEVGRAIAGTLGERNREEIIKAMREYKKSRTREKFETVLQTCLK
jgi:putative serine/threonine protein kinase